MLCKFPKAIDRSHKAVICNMQYETVQVTKYKPEIVILILDANNVYQA